MLLVLHDVSDRERRRRAEREFVANASHELRTPLAAIASAVERLQAGAREDPEKRDRFIGHIQRESGRLNRLTASLLVLARAQTHEEVPRREEIVLRELMEEVLRGLEFGPDVELILECPPDLSVSSNRDLLEHAVRNLASNAARHTSHGEVRVSASLHDGTPCDQRCGHRRWHSGLGAQPAVRPLLQGAERGSRASALGSGFRSRRKQSRR